MSQRNSRRALLTLVCVLAFGLRTYGLGWGQPFMYHPDERSMVGRAMNMVSTGDLHPHYFLKPSLFIYTQALVVSLLARVSQAPVREVRPPGTAPWEPPRSAFPYYWWGRLVAALLGSVSIWIVYHIGKRLYSDSVGLWAAFFLCLSPLHVRDSHYAQVDVPVTFVCLLTFLFTVRAFQEGKPRDWVLASLFAGLSASTKYPAGLMVLPCVVALLLCQRRLSRTFWWGSLGIGLVCVFGFVIGTPYAVLEFSQFFYAGIATEWAHYSTGHPGFEGRANWWWYLHGLFWSSLGPAMCIPIVAGFVSGMSVFLQPSRKKERPQEILFVCFPLLYFLFVSSFTVRFGRQLMPILPFLALWGGRACDGAAQWLTGRLLTWEKPALGQYVIPSLVLLVGLSPFVQIVQDDYRLTLKDTRTQAFEWIEENLNMTTVVREAYTPQVHHLHSLRVQYVRSAGKIDLDAYRARRVTYLIVSSQQYDRYFANPAKYQRRVENYQRIFALPLVAEFKPSEILQGPHIQIYRVWTPSSG